MSRRLFIFDLDGVLVDSKKIHFDSLNLALAKAGEQFVISEEEQKDIYEGLPTKKKLEMLTMLKGLPEDLHETIYEDKQKQSILFFKELKEDQELIDIFKAIKQWDVDIAIASNCIKETVEVCLTSLGLIDIVDLYLSNEDVKMSKPSPEIYLKCIEHFVCASFYTTIFEDSVVGKTAAIKSEARLVPIEGRASVTMDLIQSELNRKPKQINVLIPMAGEGSRFAAAGYTDPKPMIDVNGKSMINLVHDNIGLDAHYIFVAKEEHISKYNLREHIESFCKNFTLIPQDGRLEGAAKSALLARDLIDNDSPLLIANSDQYVLWDPETVMEKLISSGIEGSMLTFLSNESKWSYAKKNIYGLVDRVAEKEVISNSATCGIYYWSTGSNFVKYAEKMIAKNTKTNNEFYICPVYNEAILDGRVINTVLVKEMAGLGTPEDLKEYLKMSLTIETGVGVEEVSKMTGSEICVKYKNPSFKFYEGGERSLGLFERWNPEGKIFSIPEELDLLRGMNRFMVNPIIDSIHDSPKKAFDGRSVYLIAYTARFFHFMLEHLPKIFFLKQKDPNFKLLMFADEKKNKDGIFFGLNGTPEYQGREGDGSSFKFWLDLLEIDYECFNIEDIPFINLNFDSAYVFYESCFTLDLNEEDIYNRVILNGSPVYKDKKEYYPSISLDRGNLSADLDTINWARPYILKEFESRFTVSDNNKKTYISRRNYIRCHPNEVEIEKYFVSKGYEPVFMEDLNPLEQIKVIRESSDVVCFLGSSIVNLYYGNPETNVTFLTLDSTQDNFVETMTNYYSTVLKDNKMNVTTVTIPEKIEGDVFQTIKDLVENNNGI